MVKHMANKKQMRVALMRIRAAMQTGPSSDSILMKAWDGARELLLEGNQSDFPRMCFESVIDQISEWCDEGLQDEYSGDKK